MVSTNPCTGAKSDAISASTANEPMPGQANTFSTSTLAPSRNEDQPGEEHRQRYPSGRHYPADMIDDRPGPRRGQDTERYRDQHRDDEAEQRQLGRSRQPGANVAGDRLPGGERGAEVAVCEVGDIAAELHDQRLVEAELDADLLDRFLRGCRPREI